MLFVLRFREINIGGILQAFLKLIIQSTFCMEKILKLLFTQLKMRANQIKKLKNINWLAFAKT